MYFLRVSVLRVTRHRCYALSDEIIFCVFALSCWFLAVWITATVLTQLHWTLGELTLVSSPPGRPFHRCPLEVGCWQPTACTLTLRSFAPSSWCIFIYCACFVLFSPKLFLKFFEIFQTLQKAIKSNNNNKQIVLRINLTRNMQNLRKALEHS